MYERLVQQLRERFGESAARCGASSETVSQCKTVTSGALEEALDTARLEFSQIKPVLRVKAFSGDQVNFDTEPFAIEGVYLEAAEAAQHPALAYGFDPGELARYYADPEIALSNVRDYSHDYIDAIYRERARTEVDFRLFGTTLKISAKNRFGRAEVHFYDMRDWSEMPEWATPHVIRMALVHLIDALTISAQGVLRVPTPVGNFEFDAGRVMQGLRTKLAEESHRALTARTGGTIQG